ncbi:MAG TPA: hypothetical protein VHO49_13250 [Anaerolineales bacterium]|nr:hypothetical protein [Anaerolineales bacterium]
MQKCNTEDFQKFDPLAGGQPPGTVRVFDMETAHAPEVGVGLRAAPHRDTTAGLSDLRSVVVLCLGRSLGYHSGVLREDLRQAGSTRPFLLRGRLACLLSTVYWFL